MDRKKTQNKFIELIDLISTLRGPEGCPWDKAQEKSDIGRYLIEEAYEVIEALEDASPEAIREELGDLLFQILFIARIAEETDEFNIADVLDEITAKMIRRHPHVFGETETRNIEDIRNNWERIKTEVEHKKQNDSEISKDLPSHLSALAKAQRITARAAETGFDWPDTTGVLNKLDEELAEFRAAMASHETQRMEEEAGDLLFTMVNLCRFIGADAEVVLRASLKKFIDRFTFIERELRSKGIIPESLSLTEMDRLWEEAKKRGYPDKK